MNLKTLALTIAVLTSGCLHKYMYAQTGMTWFDPTTTADKSNEGNEGIDCETLKDGYQSDLGLLVTEFVARPFFTYTHPQIRKYLNGQPLMECSAKVQRVNENHFVIIEFKINSTRAKTNYGNLEKDVKIKVNLMNNEHLYLKSIERDRGKVRKNLQRTTYVGTYAISSADIDLLKKHSIDKVTVLWEEGVEEYEIVNVDLIKNQLGCLN